MVQGTWGTSGTATLFKCSGHLVNRMHFHWMLHQKTILFRQWLWDRTNLPDIFSFRNSHNQNLAWNLKTTRLQGFIPSLEKTKLERTLTINIIERNRVAIANAIAKPLGSHQCPRRPKPRIPKICLDLTNDLKLYYQQEIKISSTSYL